ncbi:hypothetical protein SS05631_b52330 (plasmid) [Sinorhizobium sp. CCBAU 05631]|nr:hypothetical protein SS05631_b52330 [Sinorhizobium sp. CCBAU 05631]
MRSTATLVFSECFWPLSGCRSAEKRRDEDLGRRQIDQAAHHASAVPALALRRP